MTIGPGTKNTMIPTITNRVHRSGKLGVTVTLFSL
jgi:hypothetical protein